MQRMLDAINSKFRLESRTRKAMSAVPRDIFMPRELVKFAFQIDAISIGSNQFISSPLTVAKMTQYLESESCDSVLEIGCGSGYQAAILAQLFRRVFSIERIDKLRNEALSRFRTLNISNIHTKLDDGQNGWEKFAPFERILFSASIATIPPKIIAQLGEGGILVAPILHPNGTQTITRFTKKYGRFELLDKKDSCEFVLVKNGVEL